ncbi:MAG: zinc ribbon domain-containing protein [Bacteroidaceae bacterium]|nr:zinc ribbon domain-containing protein [Bacteroidaceae bacterium]
MVMINCPECGKQISDTVEQCPNCGYPISSERDVVYYDKNIDGNQCKLTSSLWRFGDKNTIHVQSVSSVVREQYVMPKWLKIVIWLIPTIVFIIEMATTMGYCGEEIGEYHWAWQGWIGYSLLSPLLDFLVIFGGAGLFYLLFFLLQHDRIVVISRSGERISAIQYRHLNDDLTPLYEAALKCLKESTLLQQDDV